MFSGLFTGNANTCGWNKYHGVFVCTKINWDFNVKTQLCIL